MIIRNFYKDKYERLKLRKRKKLKIHAVNSKEEKYLVYVFRSNRHFYLQLIVQGFVIASANTVHYKKTNTGKFRSEIVPLVVKDFYDKVKVVLPDISLSQILYDISYYRYQGNVKIAIDYFRELALKKITKL